MKQYSREQISRADRTNLAPVLLKRGYTLQKYNEGWKVNELSGVTIYGNRWFSFPMRKGGKAVSFLTEYAQMDFRDAMRELLREDPAIDTERRTVPGPAPFPDRLLLPLPSAGHTDILECLGGMGIDRQTVLDCIGRKLLYETEHLIRVDRKQYPCDPSAVFVGRDLSGAAAYAYVLPCSGTKGYMVPGSDKAYCFALPEPGSGLLFVFENAYDLLAHKTLEKMGRTPAGHRISLDGTEPYALEEYLVSHPSVKEVRLCLTDGAAPMRLKDSIESSFPVSVSVSVPDKGKNFSDWLMSLSGKTAAETPEIGSEIFRKEKDDMPNHITNILKFSCSPEKFSEIAEFVRPEDGYLGSVDFNKLLPMPKALDIEAGSRGDRGLRLYMSYRMDDSRASTPEEKQAVLGKYRDMCKNDPGMFELGRQYYENIQKYNSPHWYDWCTEHWGTKWNAYDCEEILPEEKKLAFHTAWSAVPEITMKLSEKFPGEEIRYSWADEDIGFNVGEVIIRDGSIKEYNLPVPGSREAYEMSSRVMELNLADFGLYLTEDRSTYKFDQARYDARCGRTGHDLPEKTKQRSRER